MMMPYIGTSITQANSMHADCSPQGVCPDFMEACSCMHLACAGDCMSVHRYKAKTTHPRMNVDEF